MDVDTYSLQVPLKASRTVAASITYSVNKDNAVHKNHWTNAIRIRQLLDYEIKVMLS